MAVSCFAEMDGCGWADPSLKYEGL